MEEFSAIPASSFSGGSVKLRRRLHDRQRDSPVATKTLSHVRSPASCGPFALAGITHPDLVTLCELTSSSAEWFFTMELIDGASFLDLHRTDM
jgi:hypothetical protein